MRHPPLLPVNTCLLTPVGLLSALRCAVSGQAADAAVLRAASVAAAAARGGVRGSGPPPPPPDAPGFALDDGDDLYSELADMNAKLQAELEHVASVQAQLAAQEEAVRGVPAASPSVAARIHRGAQ